MDCIIEWNGLSVPEWEARFATLRRANLLQSYDYARAACPVYRQKARWGLIKIDGAEAGMVQIFEAGILWNLLHGLILDCGPLWFEGYGSASHIQVFFKEFDRLFPRRFGRRRRILPDIEDGPAARALLANLGYERLDVPGYQTVWLDLTQDEALLRAQMKPNWRNKLSKAERAGLLVEWDRKGRFFASVLRNYKRDQVKKDYKGPSARILKALVSVFAPKEKILIGRAIIKGKIVAETLFFLHGKSATYQVGWTSEDGRRTAAHHLLLWRAMPYLKEAGITDLDLGGGNDDTAKGVKQFKEGMGGQTLCYVGHYL